MWLSARLAPLRAAIACMVVLLALTGCAGYTLTADTPSSLGDGTKTLKIKGVQNPTLYSNLPYILRSDLRDEITERKLAIWKDSGPADYELQIRVTQLTLRRWAGMQKEVETLYSSVMGMEYILYNGNTNTVAWQSGVRYYSEVIETYDETAAMRESSRFLTRELVDAMRRNF